MDNATTTNPAPTQTGFDFGALLEPAKVPTAAELIADVVVKVLSYGGGLDSWAMLLDAIDRGELPDLVIFADVGDALGLDPAEWPSTYAHIRDFVIPLCDEHGIEFKWLGTMESPIRCTKKNPAGHRSLFAYYVSQSMFPGRVSKVCTSAAKVERIAKYVETRWPVGKIEMWVGFGAGETERVEKDLERRRKAGDSARRVTRFPLMERGLCRCRSEKMARDSGLPVPRKSACMMCPMTTRGDFQRMAVEAPERFAQIAKLEADSKLTKSGKRLTYGSISVGGKSQPAELAEWIIDRTRPYRRQLGECPVCHAPQKATKATGCDYLTDAEAFVPASSLVRTAA